jgi:hydroxyacylglutathione hydrolase
MSGLIRLRKKDRGEPDIYLEDGSSLADHGWEAQVFNTPGHSSGSISILTAYGDLFCGDLLTNSTGKPMLNSMMYDHPAGLASLAKLKTYPIKTVYPGHGPAFAWEALAG